MARIISDDDIRGFLLLNGPQHTSQVALLQAAVRRLWPEGAPAQEVERVVRLCLAQSPGGGARLLPPADPAGLRAA